MNNEEIKKKIYDVLDRCNEEANNEYIKRYNQFLGSRLNYSERIMYLLKVFEILERDSEELSNNDIINVGNWIESKDLLVSYDDEISFFMDDTVFDYLLEEDKEALRGWLDGNGISFEEFSTLYRFGKQKYINEIKKDYARKAAYRKAEDYGWSWDKAFEKCLEKEGYIYDEDIILENILDRENQVYGYWINNKVDLEVFEPNKIINKIKDELNIKENEEIEILDTDIYNLFNVENYMDVISSKIELEMNKLVKSSNKEVDKNTLQNELQGMVKDIKEIPETKVSENDEFVKQNDEHSKENEMLP